MKATLEWWRVRKYFFTTKIIICGLWKELEHDYMKNIISWLLWISRVSGHSEGYVTEFLALELAKVISLSFPSTNVSCM